MSFHALALTLFPEMFPGFLNYSLAGKAKEEGLWSMDTLNLRTFGLTKHRCVDDTPYGGGAGMVMRADVLDAALYEAFEKAPHNTMIYMSPRGAPLTQKKAHALAQTPGVTILCGRFEGVDERIFSKWPLEEISIGDYILSGGEVAALTMLDAVIRLIPGVMGNQYSAVSESFSDDLLEYPQYTKPHTWNDTIVPDILLSGDHKKIADWRQAQAEKITKERRPDLWARFRMKQDRNEGV